MGLLQVKKGHFGLVPLALFMVTIRFPKFHFLTGCVLYLGLLGRQDHISLCAPLSRGQRLVTPGRSSWGGGLGGDLESHWFNSADADQAPAACPELCDVLGGGGGAEREGGKARSSVIPKVPRE